jgi:hypothetical protein
MKWPPNERRTVRYLGLARNCALLSKSIKYAKCEISQSARLIIFVADQIFDADQRYLRNRVPLLTKKIVMQIRYEVQRKQSSLLLVLLILWSKLICIVEKSISRLPS